MTKAFFDFDGTEHTINSLLDIILSNENITHIFLDFGGTLVDMKSDVENKIVCEIAIKTGVILSPSEFRRAIDDEWIRIRGEENSQNDINGITDETKEYAYWSNFYQNVLHNLKVFSYEKELLDMLCSFQISPDSYSLLDDMDYFVKTIHANNIGLSILSNAFPSFMSIFKQLEISSLFGYTFLSYEIGLCKPNQSFFQVALTKNNVKPSNVIFIDDSDGFISSARTMGMNVVRAKRLFIQ